MQKIIIAMTNLKEKKMSIRDFKSEKEALSNLRENFPFTRVDRLPEREVMIKNKELLYLVKVTKIDIPNQTSIAVHGGYLKATASGDENYPGISIDFYPNDDTDGSITQLALVEQNDDRLRCYTWNKAWCEEPEYSDYEYDTVLMAQIAYSFYKKNVLQPIPFDDFKHTVFKDDAYMKRILSQTLYNLFVNTKEPM